MAPSTNTSALAGSNPLSFDTFMEFFALQFVVRHDPERLRRTEKRMGAAAKTNPDSFLGDYGPFGLLAKLYRRG